MPNRVKVLRVIILAILAAAALSITLITLAQAQVQLRPFMTLKGEATRIDYYNMSSITAPTLVIRAYLNNTPVPITVSLFAFTPTKIYTIGYYYGVGAVTINLTNPLMTNAASAWKVAGLWPSLLAFVTTHPMRHTP